MLKCLHRAVSVEDRDFGEKLKSLPWTALPRSVGIKGGGRQLDCSCRE